MLKPSHSLRNQNNFQKSQELILLLFSVSPFYFLFVCLFSFPNDQNKWVLRREEGCQRTTCLYSTNIQENNEKMLACIFWLWALQGLKFTMSFVLVWSFFFCYSSKKEKNLKITIASKEPLGALTWMDSGVHSWELTPLPGRVGCLEIKTNLPLKPEFLGFHESMINSH